MGLEKEVAAVVVAWLVAWVGGWVAGWMAGYAVSDRGWWVGVGDGEDPVGVHVDGALYGPRRGPEREA